MSWKNILKDSLDDDDEASHYKWKVRTLKKLKGLEDEARDIEDELSDTRYDNTYKQRQHLQKELAETYRQIKELEWKYYEGGERT